jgi:AcrR family transcriptional regulator
MVAAAVAEICHEFGTRALTANTICTLARVSRATFYKLFTSVDECLSFAVEDAYTRLFVPLVDAGLAYPWLKRTEVALRVLFEQFAAEPLSAELYLVHSFRLSAEPSGIGPWRGAADLERLLAAGREEAILGGGEPAGTAEEYWASATLAIATKAILNREADRLPEQAPQLTRLIGESYLGGPRRVGSLASGSGK